VNAALNVAKPSGLTVADAGLPLTLAMVVGRFNLGEVSQTLDALNEVGRFMVDTQLHLDLGHSDACPAPSDIARA